MLLNYGNTGVTVELRKLVESGIDVWAFDYPSYYKGDDKKAFEQKVLDHFWFRQIGQETPGRWLHYFRSRIREIMPYYIQRYESVELLKNAGDPFEAYNLTEEYTEDTKDTGKTTGKSSTNSNSTAENVKRFSNTPQGSVENLDTYLTEATRDNGTGTEKASGSSEGTTEGTGKKTYKMTRKGNIGVQPLGQEVNVYRSALINVDMEIIKELNDLFLLVY